MRKSQALSETPNASRWQPDSLGRFGGYGGRYVPEILIPALDELAEAYSQAKSDRRFKDELDGLLQNYAGRPTPLYEARRWSERLGGARIFLKREDLTHTGAHKINNTLGQVLLARRMGKRRIIAETGAGQHGVATATAAALMGMECMVYMGEVDIKRQSLNVTRMQMLGATVRPVSSGGATLKDAVNEAFRDWATNVATTHYIIGSVIGSHPFPQMVRDFQSVIGREARAQALETLGRLPDAVMACVGAGSNALGMFHAFLDDAVDMIGVEAGGMGLETGKHSASLCAGSPGVLHGALIHLLQDGHGQVLEAHSMAAGLDYPGVGPEHSHLKDLNRVSYTSVTDHQALEAFTDLARTEGIIPALESAHALAHVKRFAPSLQKGQALLVCLSGRGDKDVAQVEAALEDMK